jgi:hypothetical protein
MRGALTFVRNQLPVARSKCRALEGYVAVGGSRLPIDWTSPNFPCGQSSLSMHARSRTRILNDCAIHRSPAPFTLQDPQSTAIALLILRRITKTHHPRPHGEASASFVHDANLPISSPSSSRASLALGTLFGRANVKCTKISNVR